MTESYNILRQEEMHNVTYFMTILNGVAGCCGSAADIILSINICNMRPRVVRNKRWHKKMNLQ